MRLFVGLDVSSTKTAICVVSEHGKIMKKAQVASEPDELVRWAREQEGTIVAIGPLVAVVAWRDERSGAGCRPDGNPPGAGFPEGPIIQTGPIKTDRRDAEEIAQLLHMGWFRPVHCKSVSAQEVRAVLGPGRLSNRLCSRWKCHYAVCCATSGVIGRCHLPRAGMSTASANWQWAIRCRRPRHDRCFGREHPCERNWRDWNAAFANSPKLTQYADG